MNKKGYTLAEALITLGIIGIIAALVVPAANKARPNENKIKFLQTYDAIETQIKNFASNTRYFPTCQDFNDGNGTRCFPDYPLYNTSGGVVDDRLDADGLPIGILISTPGSNRPLPSNYNPALNVPAPNGYNKLCYLLADAMDGEVSLNNGVCTFSTPNGVSFAMTVIPNLRLVNAPFMVTNIAFNVEGQALDSADVINLSLNSNDPHLFSLANENIQDVSTYLLYVFSDGSIIPGDTASAYYLATRKSSRDSNVSNNDIRNIVSQKYGNTFNQNMSIWTLVNDERINAGTNRSSYIFSY